MRRVLAVLGVALVLPLGGVLAGCQGFHTYDCTATRPVLQFTNGDTTTTSWAIHCRSEPRSISVQVRTYWWNRAPRKWDLVSKYVITLANLPRAGHSRAYHVQGLCYRHTRERVHIFGHSVSSNGNYSQKSYYAPGKFGRLTRGCGVVVGGH